MWLFFSIPVIFILGGGILWTWSPTTKPKLSEFGKMLVFVGAFWLCWSLTSHYFPALAAHKPG
jgi:hypothetical protein